MSQKADFKQKTDAKRKNENPGPVKAKTGQFQLTEKGARAQKQNMKK
jgi:hypothetical protein